jgi:hypothetical protein
MLVSLVLEVVMDDEKARQASVREAALKTMGLVVLLARGEGRLTFTREEYDEILARYGGPAQFAIHIETLGPSSGGGPDEVQLTLIRKPPANADLMA